MYEFNNKLNFIFIDCLSCTVYIIKCRYLITMKNNL